MIETFSFILSMVIVFILIGFAAIISERVGIISIGIEANIAFASLFYAFISSWGGVGTASSVNQLWIMPMVGILTGIFSGLHTYLTIRYKLNQVVSGLLLSIFVTAVSMAIAFGNANEDGLWVAYSQNVWAASDVPTDFGYIFTIGWILGIPLLIMSITIFNTTRFGKTIRAIGKDPVKAKNIGINVMLIQVLALTFSGILVGFAGSLFTQVTFETGYTGTTYGIGFIGLIVVAIGRRTTLFTIVSSIIIGVLFGIFINPGHIIFLSDNKYNELLKIIPYVASILGVMIFARKSFIPDIFTRPYR